MFEALGPWILNPRDQRQQHRAYYQQRGETRAEEALWVKIGDAYTRCKILYDRWHYKETDEHREWHNLPDEMFPVEAWPRLLDGQWRLTYCGSKAVPLHPRMAGAFLEFIQRLPEWERELLQFLELASDAHSVGVAISHGLRVESDGSVWDNNQGAFGWTLSTDQGDRMARCMGPARGARLDSYRAGAYGMLSVLCFLNDSRNTLDKGTSGKASWPQIAKVCWTPSQTDITYRRRPVTTDHAR